MDNSTTQVKTISAEKFISLNQSKICVIDLREKDAVLVHPFTNALNFPFSTIWSDIDDIPKDKPVYVFCHTGELSKEIVSILSERGYDATNIEGGYAAIFNEVSKNPIRLDAKNLKCPGLIIKVSDAVKKSFERQHVVVESTEHSFSSDIAVWCERTGNKLVSINNDNGVVCAEIEKNSQKQINKNNLVVENNGKNFIIFSCDLDKAIAAFIMANGAAAMGRNVTMFFTFWGLNILRKPKKVSTTKTFVEKIFSFMMPRGTKELGLSRMNMGGLGAEMIRKIMNEKEISSLEDLIKSAVSRGVKLIACKMTMDIMGIQEKELIDGIEFGGVSSFLGAAEKSDMSLFI